MIAKPFLSKSLELEFLLKRIYVEVETNSQPSVHQVENAATKHTHFNTIRTDFHGLLLQRDII